MARKKLSKTLNTDDNGAEDADIADAQCASNGVSPASPAHPAHLQHLGSSSGLRLDAPQRGEFSKVCDRQEMKEPLCFSHGSSKLFYSPRSSIHPTHPLWFTSFSSAAPDERAKPFLLSFASGSFVTPHEPG